MAEIQTVGVVGAGTMGSGIAHVFARAGFSVLLCDIEQRFLDRALKQIRANLGREAVKGKLAEAEIEPALARIQLTLDREALGASELVVEAASERYELKADSSLRSTAFCRKAPSWPPTPPLSPSPSWPPALAARSRSSECTSSTPCR